MHDYREPTKDRRYGISDSGLYIYKPADKGFIRHPSFKMRGHIIQTDYNTGDTVFIADTSSGILYRSFDAMQSYLTKSGYTIRNMVMLNGRCGWISTKDNRLLYTNNAWESYSEEKFFEGKAVTGVYMSADRRSVMAAVGGRTIYVF